MFHNWRVEEVVHKGEPLYFGLDFGFAHSRLAAVRCWIDQEKREIYIDHEVYRVGVELNHIPDYLDTMPGSRHYSISADDSRPDTISYLRNKGFNVNGAPKGKGSVLDGVSFLKDHTIIVHPRCKGVMDELTLYSYKVDKRTGMVLPETEKANDDLIDSTRYALYLFIKGTPEIYVG